MVAGPVHRVIVAVALLATTAGAAAHGDPTDAESHGAVAGGAAWIVLSLLLAAALYGRGLARLWHAAAPGRGIRLREAAAFGAALTLLAASLLGPLDAWTESSFAAHMAQHEVLMLVVAPLLVLGRPLGVWAWALSPAMRRRMHALFVRTAWRRAWQLFSRPLGATLLQLATLFAWHVPSWFDYATTHAGVHALQHTSFLVAALCFWWALRAPATVRGATADAVAGVAIACLFVTMLATGALGALLTFAPAPWYRVYGGVQVPWAMSALEDQQLGGLLMWVPGGTVYFVAGLLHAWRLIARESQTRNLAPVTR